MPKILYTILFLPLLLPFCVSANVILNEIAWMGNSESWQNEWIELYSIEEIDISGWSIENASSKNQPVFLSGKIKGYVLIKDTKLSLQNDYSKNGELILKDQNGQIIDRTGTSVDWPAGDNEDKRTMERIENGWQSSMIVDGTPGEKNSEKKERATLEKKNTEPVENNVRKDSFSTFILAIIVAFSSAIVALLIFKRF